MATNTTPNHIYTAHLGTKALLTKGFATLLRAETMAFICLLIMKNDCLKMNEQESCAGSAERRLKADKMLKYLLPMFLMAVLLPLASAQTPPVAFHDLRISLPASWKRGAAQAAPDTAVWSRVRPKSPTQSFIVAYWPGLPPTPGGTMVVARRFPITTAGTKTEVLETSAFQGFDQKVLVVFLQKGEARYRLVGRGMERTEFERLLSKLTWAKGN